ncbi:MAG: glutathione S-transferase [Pelagibacterales bacterium]|nr:glutathione S-transferase [Pelagibacterales bacterium]|tara:strand:+ start:7485 stop:8123 length:639 start_codon:yes stop_codon:yes gene_type:complete
MKLYEFKRAPNPRRVQMFLVEKKIDVEYVQVNVRAGENRESNFLSINPKSGVPALELDNGTVISESMAICRYFDAMQPEPYIFGETPEEKGLVEMWNRKVEIEGMNPIGECLRNSSEAFIDRAVADPRATKQIPELASRGIMLGNRFLDDINERLNQAEYVAGNNFSMADINLYVFLDFASWVKVIPNDNHKYLLRWKEMIGKRDSAKVFEG